MIYNYYCMDCGNLISGNEISFDLGGLISGNEENAPLSIGRLSKITAQELVFLAKRHNIELSHNHKTRMIVSLREYLKILVRNKGKAEGRELAIMQEFRSISAEDIDGFLNEAVGIIYETAEGQEVEAEKIKAYVSYLKSWFPLSDSVEKQIIAEDSNGEGGIQTIRALKKNPGNYEAGFWIEPVFFEDGKSSSLYSVRASRTEHAASYAPISVFVVFRGKERPHEIRGYCPICGKPVVKGAGKYPHIMVGMLGAQSAGKTSLIMSMIRELKKDDTYRQLNLEYPGEILCDSKYLVMRKNEELYDKGWAVEKTLADTDANTFNATYLFSDRNGITSKLVTLIDIAGEQCYDKEIGGLSTVAEKIFPLITQCSLYILCSCIDQTAYGNADGKAAEEEERIEPHAVMQIAKDIYKVRKVRKEKMPPLCIVMTKDDLARDANGQPDDNNPFAGIKPVSEANYLFASKLSDLSLTYESCPDPNIRQSLSWAVNVFDQMTTKTYVSMMSCSALGRLAARYEGNPDKIPIYKDPVTHEAVPFTRKNITDLWKWVLMAGGIVPVMGTTYRFPHIPSFIESYGNGPGMFRINVPELKNRLAGIQRMFINVSRKDYQIYQELITPVPEPTLPYPFRDPMIERLKREKLKRLEAICLNPDK